MINFKKGDKVYVWNAEELEIRHIYGADKPILGDIISDENGVCRVKSIIDDMVYVMPHDEVFLVGTGPNTKIKNLVKTELDAIMYYNEEYGDDRVAEAAKILIRYLSR